MVLDASASFIFSKIPSSQYVIYGLGAAAIVATRKWSAGYTSKEERDLHNKTFILIVRPLFQDLLSFLS